MLEKSPDICRFYIIDKDRLEVYKFSQHRSRIIFSRPSPWGVFLCGLMRASYHLAFVRLPERLMERYKTYRVAATPIDAETIRINGLRAIIEPWTIWNVCIFCFEGIKYGSFQRFWGWRW